MLVCHFYSFSSRCIICSIKILWGFIWCGYRSQTFLLVIFLRGYVLLLILVHTLIILLNFHQICCCLAFRIPSGFLNPIKRKIARYSIWIIRIIIKCQITLPIHLGNQALVGICSLYISRMWLYKHFFIRYLSTGPFIKLLIILKLN